VDGTADGDGFWAELASLHRQLTSNQWDVVMRYTTGTPIDEIAETLGVSSPAVRKTLRRAGERIFAFTAHSVTDASLGAWAHRHVACCRPPTKRPA